MASINKESNGRRTIQFVAGDGKRRSIRLGKKPTSNRRCGIRCSNPPKGPATSRKPASKK